MSENIQHQPSEEVDLGQLFKLIGNTFNRLFKFIGSILNSLFLAFVWLIFFIRRHIVKLGLAAVIGFGFGYLKEKTSDPVFKSSIVIKQNYETGEVLNSLVERYNDLISEKDSIVLAENLKISPKQANSLKELKLESILDENQKLKLFDVYTKEMDSVLASSISFESYLEKGKEYDYRYQRITLKAKSKDVFNKVLTQLVANVESNTFFKNEQKKDLVELTNRENIIKESLKESDSLQKVYQFVLEKSVEASVGSQTSVTIDNTEDKSITKEFELYTKDLELRRELVQIEREKEDLADIIEIVSNVQSDGTFDFKTDIFGFSIGTKVFYSVSLIILVFIVLIGLEFLKFLEKYKDKV
ncbi:hypothetical protein RXV94_00735 [Yeosuana sp. MJ-SS3]|uniref:Polysaccharide chain length determinant N-terminal domain-containing protein n=1 Tax=Gilvirhabdus luticola TaxID=3079858 RepID=A0ABU3U2P3_9FLAO|nr:hypothetical protein [Yeosuana sp. MJ-SS3]MDU8884665.1 hypothetical protein [Yeosuana sp. MJ-SS3]